ncbi:hypothetical protein MMC07_004728 [Pseudocyphellaria aurata]|nr:hypothetical protein [Pseudocyphellaria aurata]
MAGMTTRSAAAQHTENPTVESSSSKLNSAPTITVPTNTVTISRAEFNAMQAKMAAFREQLSALALVTNPVASPTPVAGAATLVVAAPPISLAPADPVVAPGPVATPVAPPIGAPVAAPVAAPAALVEYRGKGPKPEKYSRGSRGKYNIFIEQCKLNFILENNHINAGKVAYRSAFLDNTSAKIWKAYQTTHLAVTWDDFNKVVYAELGDVANIQRTLTKEYHRARQGQDKTVQAYAARLDELAQDIGKIRSEEDRAEKFRLGLRYAIKSDIDRQASQPNTYRDLVAQAQRIKFYKRQNKSNGDQTDHKLNN